MKKAIVAAVCLVVVAVGATTIVSFAMKNQKQEMGHRLSDPFQSQARLLMIQLTQGTVDEAETDTSIKAIAGIAHDAAEKRYAYDLQLMEVGARRDVDTTTRTWDLINKIKAQMATGDRSDVGDEKTELKILSDTVQRLGAQNHACLMNLKSGADSGWFVDNDACTRAAVQ